VKPDEVLKEEILALKDPVSEKPSYFSSAVMIGFLDKRRKKKNSQTVIS
jgi:hypothetical protein